MPGSSDKQPTADVFKIVFDVLSKSSDRTRSVVYFTIVLNFSVFIALMSAWIFPISDQRVVSFERILDECVSHRPTSATEEPGRRSSAAGSESDCTKLLEHSGYLRAGILYKPDVPDVYKNMKTQQEYFSDKVLQEILLEHVKQRVDFDVSVHRFRFPVFGIEIDIIYMWVVSSFVGLFSFVIIRACLRTENRNMYLTIRAAGSDRLLKELIESTQVLSPAMPPPAWVYEYIAEWPERIVIWCIRLMPILSQVFVIWNFTEVTLDIACPYR